MRLEEKPTAGTELFKKKAGRAGGCRPKGEGVYTVSDSEWPCWQSTWRLLSPATNELQPLVR